ncbi:acid-sensing ion channel 1C [Nephila pilipes]|uniref:Acid-sensing ion channel 1C n=1 Tax=Nephila pilipes TaxID=299642 RepID=A0A8X6PI89_NEPPI|nr:acid-sensing ion channel 1C [Nephila pilipes]
MKRVNYPRKNNTHIHAPDKSDGSNNKNNSKNEKLANKKLKAKFQNSSIYAVAQMAHSKNLFGKILWTLILTTALMGCCYYIYRFMDLYFTYPIKVTLEKEEPSSVTFPSVTFCNMNRMKIEFEHCLASLSNLQIPFECRPGFGPFFPPGLTLPERRNIFSCNSYLSGKEPKGVNSFTEFFDKYSKFSVQFRRKYGHQLRDFIQNCSFKGKPFKEWQFKMSLSFRYGNCFTFNPYSEIPTEEEFNIRSEGRNGGLELIMNVEPHQYLPISHTVGVKVIVHNSREDSIPEENGITVMPGYETDIQLQQNMIRRLPVPYKDGCVSYENSNDLSWKSQRACMQACVQEYNFAKCGCIENEFQDNLNPEGSRRQCDLKNSSDICCLDSVLNHLATHGTNCSCPLSCEATIFTTHTTMATWPSSASFFKGKSNISNEDWISLRNYRASHAKVNIFFSTFEKTVYEQKPHFLQSEIFSHLGGELGLWLGLSIVAVFEFGEVLLFFANSVLFRS